MTGEEAELLLKEVDLKLRKRAANSVQESKLHSAYMYGALREACWMHMSRDVELETILRGA